METVLTILTPILLAPTAGKIFKKACDKYIRHAPKNVKKQKRNMHSSHRRGIRACSNKIYMCAILVCILKLQPTYAQSNFRQDFEQLEIHELTRVMESITCLSFGFIAFLLYKFFMNRVQTISSANEVVADLQCKDLEYRHQHSVNNTILATSGKQISSKDLVKVSKVFRDFKLQSLNMPYIADFIRNQRIFNREKDYVLRLGEHIIHFLCGIYLHVDLRKKKKIRKAGILHQVTGFLMMRSSSSITTQLFNSEICDMIVARVEQVIEPNPQSFETFLKRARQNLDTVTDLPDTEFCTRMKKLILCIVTHCTFADSKITFDKLGYTFMESEAIKRKFSNPWNITMTIADSLLFLCEKGYQIYKCKSTLPIFHSGHEYVQYASEVNKLKEEVRYYHNPELYYQDFGNDFCESKFINRLECLIEQGENINKFACKLSKFEKEKMFQLLCSIKQLRMELYSKKACREGRKAPFSILIYGESGIAKSSLQELIYLHCCKVLKLDDGDNYKYTVNPDAKHMDGLTASTHTIIIDDVGAKNPDLGADASVELILQLRNNVPFVAPMAAVEDKGRIPFRGKLLIGSTNVLHINAKAYYSHPSAVQRRFPYIIEPVLKPEFVDPATKGIDKLKIPDSLDDGCYLDLWTYRIYEIPIQTVKVLFKTAEPRIIMDNLNQKEMLKWLTKEIHAHEESQNKFKTHIQHMREVKLCDLCELPTGLCDCMQASHIQLPASFTFTEWMIFFIIYHSLLMLSYIPGAERTMTFICGYFVRRLLSKYIEIRFNNFCYQRIGERIQRTFKPPKKFKYILAAVPLLYTLKKVWDMYTSWNSVEAECQGITTSSEISEGVRPKGDTKNQENVWYKNEYIVTPFEMGAHITSTKGMHINEFIKLIERNCINATFTDHLNQKVLRARGICLKGNYYLFNKHLVPDVVELDLTLVQSTSVNGVNSNFNCKIFSGDIQRSPDEDFVIIKVLGLPPKKDILKFFPDEEVKMKNKGISIGRIHDGSIEHCNFNPVRFEQVIHVSCLGQISAWVANSTTRETANGDCGSVLVMETPLGFALGGIHSAGNGRTAIFTALDKLKLNKLLPNVVITQYNENEFISSKSAHREVGDLHKKSVFRFIEQGSAEVKGSYTGFRQQPKSRVELTPMSTFLDKYNYKVKFGSPVMKGWEPKRIAALDMIHPVTKINSDVLTEITDSFLKDILDRLNSKDLSEVQVLDMFTSINGAAGVPFIDKLNRNTSAGAPFNKSKKCYMFPIEPEGLNLDPVDITDEIKERIEYAEAIYAKGNRAHFIFKSHFKDEPRSFKKIKEKKTRVFTGAPMDFTILCRKYFLSITALIQKNRFAFEAGPGTIAQSKQWGEIYDYLTEFGSDQIIAGDYAAYDKRMPPNIILAAFEILIKVCEASNNFTETDLTIMRGIAYDTAYPLIDFFGDLVQFYGSNPSGHPLTVIINSIVNSLYMRYCYYELGNKESKSFRKNVNLFTYGDDNIMGVSKDVPWFNHTAISNILGSIDVKYTMADKEAESVPYIHISEATFLKRSWRWDEDVGAYVAPLEHESIEKMLMVWTRSKSILPEEQCIAVVSSANMEYFWYGKEIYEEKQLMLKQMIHALGYEAWIIDSTFPTWRTLYDRFWSYK
ncbi:hypothetical protein 1 [Beihai picorna-like virus 43]|uniref:hypothetical protein 1 n=1 Tax=Beihai picorna-like virus 43 TaxID=1922587 RepID=UPI00090C65BE|nr:hypothetical protein 1 [Beihai picorna-like virus 43]APG76734.1 hypothetical protein 1 [Beihai picorna-like virus 43]APG76791.1 hypothetical protein 1 [Beihai picorna-like virus 43]APG76831.1 hypothetical protein 1 [Beihai picorna-like virus 43]APG76908.1 hypothetical protein 1 [Beihai picorna-like virus 43]APG78018.1 hypothetical protein 1 [Beihai picorna-like virus 43]